MMNVSAFKKVILTSLLIAMPVFALAGGAGPGGDNPRTAAFAYIFPGVTGNQVTYGAQITGELIQKIETEVSLQLGSGQVIEFRKMGIKLMDGSPAIAVCIALSTFEKRNEVYDKIGVLQDIPLNPGYPSHWRGQCQLGKPLIPESILSVDQLSSCDAKEITQQADSVCKGDMFCRHRKTDVSEEKSLQRQGWSRLSGTSNYHRCE